MNKSKNSATGNL